MICLQCRYLKNYVSSDRLTNFNDNGQQLEETELVRSVVLKLLNSFGNKYYYVCPGQVSHLLLCSMTNAVVEIDSFATQVLGTDKFHSARLKRAYCQVKVVRKALGADGLKMYMVKKEMKKESFKHVQARRRTVFRSNVRLTAKCYLIVGH